MKYKIAEMADIRAKKVETGKTLKKIYRNPIRSGSGVRAKIPEIQKPGKKEIREKNNSKTKTF